MATLVKDDSIFAVVYEATEGIVAYPASATDGYIQPLMDGVEILPSREVKDRNVYTGTLIAATPKLGMRAVSGKMPMELKASGTEGSQPDYAIMLESLFPTVTTISARKTTKATGNTGSVLQIEDADISTFTVNDIIVVLQSGEYHPCVITAKATGAGVASITVFPTKASGSFSNSVVISKSVTFKPADTGHKSYTATAYWGNAIRQSAIGARTASMAIDSFNTGELAKILFGFEGMTYTHMASSPADYVPTLDSNLPPIILSSRIYKDGTSIDLNSVGINVEQPLKFLTSTRSANGRFAGRAANKRKVTGKIDPYVADNSVATFTDWEAGTTFSLFGFTAVPSSTAGQFDLGSIVAFYLPVCMITTPKIVDNDGVLVEDIEFVATGGVAGANAEIVVGFV